MIGPLGELGRTVEDFSNRRIRPIVEELDASSRHPEELIPDIARMGLYGITIPEAHGGGGGSYREFSEAMEMLSYGYASVADHVGLVEIVSHLLSRRGTAAQRESHLAPLLAGQLRCAYAITEPGAGSDVAGITTRARRDGGDWVVNGEKIYIHNAPVADFAVTLVVTDPEAGHRGMSVLLVPLDADGVSITNKSEKLGQRGSPLAGIHFSDVRVPADAVLGEVGRGFHQMMGALDVGRVGIASLSLGISRAALIAAVDQATTRNQFGRRIADNQGVAFPLADMATEYRAARELVHAAAAELDGGGRSTVLCSMAKLYASEACVRHASMAVQIHGGAGFIRGYEVERLYRDARITTIYEGTSEIQRMVVSRALTG